MTTTIQRPNGKTYRPRKPPTLEILTDLQDDVSSAIIFRTHDIEDATSRLTDSQIFEHELNPTAAYTAWLRLVPWGGDSGSWQTDPERGIPCVIIPAATA